MAPGDENHVHRSLAEPCRAVAKASWDIQRNTSATGEVSPPSRSLSGPGAAPARRGFASGWALSPEAQRAPVPHTSVRIAIPPICSGPGRCGDYSPQLPQIRTDPIKVSGSSMSGFAMRPFCLHEADRKPLTLTRGVTVTGFGASMCSAWFPPGDPPIGHALPSTGSSGASSPASTVVWRGPTPCLPFAALRCLRLAIPGGASEVSLPSVPNARPRARGSSSGPLYRHCPPGDGQGIPSSWRTSIVCLPCSSTPAGLRTPDQYSAAAWPLVCEKQRLPRKVFRRSIAWLSDSLSTLRRVSYPTRRKTRFQPLVRRYWTGFDPQGSNERFQSAYISSSFPELAWRNPIDRGVPAPACRTDAREVLVSSLTSRRADPG